MMTSSARRNKPAKPTRLTDIGIRALKPEAERYEQPDLSARGLYIVVHPTGRHSFAVRYRLADRSHKLTLPAGISLAVARKMAADAMAEVAAGRDPSVAKKAEKTKAAAAAVNTLQYVAEEYFKREHGKLRTAVIREQTLRRLVFPVLGRMPIDSIRRSDIIRLLDRIEDGSGTRQADLVLSYLRRIFHWHETRSDEFRSPIIRGMGRYSIADHARSRVLTDDEIRTLWTAAEANGYFGALVRFLLLTGARRGEAGGLKWDEIQDGIWTMPTERNKSKVQLVRPLSKAAISIVEAQPRLGDFVFGFNGRRQTSFGRTRADFFSKCGVTNWRIHDLRRTARTLLSRAEVSPDIGERCLGHAIGGVRGIYDHHDYLPQMKHAFEALARQIEVIVHPPAGDVVPLRKRQQG